MGASLSPVKGAVLVLSVRSASDSKRHAHRSSLGGIVTCGFGRNFSSSSGVTFLPFLAGSSVRWGGVGLAVSAAWGLVRGAVGRKPASAP